MSKTMILDAQGRPFDISAGTPGPTDDYWYQTVGAETTTGLRIDSNNAMRIIAVYTCVKVLSETVPSLPLKMYKHLDGDGKEPARDHPLQKIIHTQPNPWQTAFEFWEMAMVHLNLRGNFYAEILPGSSGSVTALIPLHPDFVDPRMMDNGKILYTVRSEDGRSRTLRQDEVFHIRGLSTGGVKGLNPIEAERESLGLSQAAEQYGASLFGNRAMPGGVLESDHVFDEKAETNLKKTFGQPGLAGANKTAVLWAGLKFKQVGLTNEDAQFLETRKFQRSEIAGMFRVPAHMINDLEKATFSNIEQEDIGFSKHTISPWLKRIEQAIQRDLIEDDEFFAEFNLDALMRGDAVTRSTAFQTQLMNGALSIDEWRAKENRNPLPDGEGEKHYVSANLKVVGEEEPEPEPVSAAPFPPAQPENEEDEATATTGIEGGPMVVINCQHSDEPGGGEPEPNTNHESESEPAAPPPSETSDEDTDNDSLTIFIEDVAQRLANTELIQLGRRAPHASEDRDRFNGWVDRFYDNHSARIRKATRSLAGFVRIGSDCMLDVDALVNRLITPASQRLLMEDPEEVLAEWRECREADIKSIIKGSIYSAD